MKRIYGLFIIACFTALAAATVLADGPSRTANEAEKAFYRTTQAVLTKVLPAPPEGWEMIDLTKLAVPDRVSSGQETYPMSESIHAVWSDPRKRAEYDVKIDEIGRKMAEEVKKYEPEVKKLTAEQDKLLKALGEAMTKQNKAEMERIQKDLAPVQEKIKKIMEAQSTTVTEAIQAAEPHDATLEMHIYLNSFTQELGLGFSQEAPVAGAEIKRLEDGGYKDSGWTEGSSFGFLGTWTIKRDGQMVWMEAQKKAGILYTSVQAVVVRVRGEKNRARKVLESLDWNALKSLLGKG